MHYKIRYRNKDEYVRLYSNFSLSNVEQVVNYCNSKGYILQEGRLLETNNKIHKPLLECLKW